MYHRPRPTMPPPPPAPPCPPLPAPLLRIAPLRSPLDATLVHEGSGPWGVDRCGLFVRCGALSLGESFSPRVDRVSRARGRQYVVAVIALLLRFVRFLSRWIRLFVAPQHKHKKVLRTEARATSVDAVRFFWNWIQTCQTPRALVESGPTPAALAPTPVGFSPSLSESGQIWPEFGGPLPTIIRLFWPILAGVVGLIPANHRPTSARLRRSWVDVGRVRPSSGRLRRPSARFGRNGTHLGRPQNAANIGSDSTASCVARSRPMRRKSRTSFGIPPGGGAMIAPCNIDDGGVRPC